MEVLASYDPDEKPRLKVIKPEIGEKCPTCHQKIERRTPRNEIQRVLTVYKMSLGINKDNKDWDRDFGVFHSIYAQKLIKVLGNWEMAADCVEETIRKIKEWNPDIEISIRKILENHADKWKRDWQEKHPVIG